MDKQPSIVHIVYSGIAGSPRGALYLAEREKGVGRPHIIFIGQAAPSKDYSIWADKSNVKYTFIKKREGIDLRFFFSLDILLRKLKPKVLFVHGTVNLWFVLPYMIRARRLKKIVVEHGPGIHLEKILASLAGRIANYFVDCIVFVSKDVRDYWHNKYHRFPKMNEVIPNGTDISEFENMHVKKLSPPAILMVAVMSEQKDYITLVRAFAEILRRKQKAQLVLLGSGPKKQEIVNEVRTLGITQNVKFISPPPRKKVIEAFNKATIYVLSTRGEGLSRSILEAMCAKLPVIATDVSGNSGFIKNNVNGILVPLENVEAMASAIEKLLKDKKLRNTLADEGYKQVVKNHSVNRTCEKYVDIIRKLLQR